VALVRNRIIPTERPPLVGEVSANFLRVEGVAWSVQRIPTAVNLGFIDRSRYFFIQVAPQLFSRGWMDPVPDPLLLRKFGRVGNRTRDLWICRHKLWSLDLQRWFYIDTCSFNIIIQTSTSSPKWDLLVCLSHIRACCISRTHYHPWCGGPNNILWRT
jgi:hypothetical protein